MADFNLPYASAFGASIRDDPVRILQRFNIKLRKPSGILSRL